MYRKAVRHLSAADARLARVIEDVGPCRFTTRVHGNHFDAVTRSIIYQQLSGRAAATIHGRVLDLFGGREPTPIELAATPDEALRAAGLSRQKLTYIKDLASHVSRGSLPIETLHELSNEEIERALVQVKGIGQWTAQMFLMFRLGRLDVLPDLDLGIRKAVQRAYRLRKLPDATRVRKIGAPWAPYRTIASWYLWRSIDGEAA